MIEIKLGQLNDNFNYAYGKLMGISGFSQPTIGNILSLAKKFDQEKDKGKQAYDKMFAEWSEPVDGSEPKVPEAKLPEWYAEVQTFFEKTLQIPGKKIKLGELSHVDLTASDYLILEPIIEGQIYAEGGQDGEENKIN